MQFEGFVACDQTQVTNRSIQVRKSKKIAVLRTANPFFHCIKICTFKFLLRGGDDFVWERGTPVEPIRTVEYEGTVGISRALRWC